MSDNIVVMRDGRIEQVGSLGMSITVRLLSLWRSFWARLTLWMFLLKVQVLTKWRLNCRILASSRWTPHKCLRAARRKKASWCCGLKSCNSATRRRSCQLGHVSATGTVEAVDYLGQSVRYFVHVGDQKLQAINMVGQALFNQGDEAQVHFDPQNCTLLGD